MFTSSTTKKILASLAALGAAAAISGLGTFATFTSSTSASQTLSSGTVAIALGAAGADNRLTVGATGLVPGDTIQRRVKLTNANGNENLASIVLTTNATTSSLLDTDATDGLHFKIERCNSGTWTESGPPYTYSCSGSRSDVLARRAIIGSNLALTGMLALTNNNTDDMVVTIDLPSTADNDFQTLSSTIAFTFTGTQRNATDK